MESFLNRRYKKKQSEQQKAAAGPSIEEGQKIEPAQAEKKDALSSETWSHWNAKIRLTNTICRSQRIRPSSEHPTI